MTGSYEAPTKSGWQNYHEGHKAHTWGWVPEEYGYIAADGTPAAGDLCYNCGRWTGPPLKRGELTRLRRDMGIR